MTKIIFLGNWGESPKQLLEKYSRQTPGSKEVWKDIVAVDKITDADYYVVLEDTHLNLPQDKTIVVKREPRFITTSVPKYKHVISWDDTNCGTTWWVNKSYDELKAMTYPKKTKQVSCIASSRHSHRLNYIKSLFKGHNNKRDCCSGITLELYGRGHVGSDYAGQFRGALEYDGLCKLKGLIDYEYSIAMENSQQKNYFTEKLADVYLSWTVPLYWGAPNISDYFPEKSYHIIDINHKDPVSEIREIINNAPDVEALSIARDVILDKTNIWEVIRVKIKEIER